MRLRGSIINSIFKYHEGITFTETDILVYDNDLYVVLRDYVGEENYTPDIASLDINNEYGTPPIVPYVTLHEYSEENQSDTAIITARAFNSIIKSYFKGLAGNGELEKITIQTTLESTAIEQLDKYIDVGAYWCEVKENIDLDRPNLVIPNGNYLLRIYPCGNEIVQELVDYINGVIFFRYMNMDLDLKINDSWSVIPNGYESLFSNQRPDNYYNILNAHISDIARKLKLVMEYDTTLWRKSFDFIKWDFTKIEESENYNEYQLQYIPNNRIINTILDMTGEQEIQQFSKEFYLNNDGASYEYLNGTDKITMTKLGNTVTIKVPLRYRLLIVYLSKDKV